jgi:uncharacterized protein (DUF885 family)
MENTQEQQPARGLTFEDVWAMFQEIGRRNKEIAEQSKAENEQLAQRIKEIAEQSKAENEQLAQRIKEIAEQSKAENEQLAQRIKEIAEQSKAENEQLAQRSRETHDQLAKMSKETDAQIKEMGRVLQKNMSDLGRKFGKVIEHMFIPNLKEKFNGFGFFFGKSSPNVLIENPKYDIYTEIDVFLENGDSALAVEIKTQANIDDVREHIDRMKKLRRYFDLHNDGRKLYGAVASAVFPKNVLDFALKQGFYVIEQSGENVNVTKPSGEAKAW